MQLSFKKNIFFVYLKLFYRLRTSFAALFNHALDTQLYYYLKIPSSVFDVKLSYIIAIHTHAIASFTVSCTIFLNFNHVMSTLNILREIYQYLVAKSWHATFILNPFLEQLIYRMKFLEVFKII